jgi:hypothetical protein
MRRLGERKVSISGIPPLNAAGLIGIGVVLGWLAGILARAAGAPIRLASVTAAAIAVVMVALSYAAGMRPWSAERTLTETAIAVGAVIGGWLAHRYWIQCLTKRARSNGVAHADPRR